eukprot:COSAG02_NODE_4517_length_5272_cov_2.579354_5_plen_83_part_00
MQNSSSPNPEKLSSSCPNLSLSWSSWAAWIRSRPVSGVENPTPEPTGEDPASGLSAAAGIPAGLKICRRSRLWLSNKPRQMR